MTSPSGFAMPKPVRITSRSSSITNSFVNGIIPVIIPTEDEIKEVLGVLGMDFPVCSYCGDTSTEWDTLRPPVINQRPAGYVSEIRNLVPGLWGTGGRRALGRTLDESPAHHLDDEGAEQTAAQIRTTVASTFRDPTRT